MCGLALRNQGHVCGNNDTSCGDGSACTSRNQQTASWLQRRVTRWMVVMRLHCSLMAYMVASSKNHCKGCQNNQWFNHLHNHFLGKFWIPHALGELPPQSMMLHKKKSLQPSSPASSPQHDDVTTLHIPSSFHQPQLGHNPAIPVIIHHLIMRKRRNR